MFIEPRAQKSHFAAAERDISFELVTHCAPLERAKCTSPISSKHLAALRPGAIL